MASVLGILAGLIISLGLGHFAVTSFLDWLRKDQPEAPSPLGTGEIPLWVSGSVERAFFTLATVAALPNLLLAMILWMAAKSAIQFGIPRAEPPAHLTAQRFVGLLETVVSLVFALVGGWVIRMGWVMMG